jgi:LmbE family N-acetylglucosaminyl deacetylase
LTLEEISTYIPHQLPQNQLRGLELFFLISTRPLLQFSRDDALLYNSINGQKSVAELGALHEGAFERLNAWHRASIIELVPPVNCGPGPHRVVIEPHMDDAALAIGGYLLNHKSQGHTTILSVTARSIFTSYFSSRRMFLDDVAVTRLREQESALASELLGATHVSLGWSEAPLRYCPPDRWHFGTPKQLSQLPQIFCKTLPRNEEVELLAQELFEALRILAPDELWIPMGLGDHVDHTTTRRACFRMLSEARSQFSGICVNMYEDIPHKAVAPGQAGQVRDVLARHGTSLTRTVEDVTDVFEEKIRVISVYGSQFKRSYMEPRVRAIAGQDAAVPGRLAEIYHRVDGRFLLPPESDLSSDSIALHSVRDGIRKLVDRRPQARKIVIEILPSSHLARWRTDIEPFLAAFPDSKVRIRAPREISWQTDVHDSPKLSMRLVDGGWLGWTGVVFRGLFQFRTPTLVLWRGAYCSGNKRIGKRVVNLFIKLLLPLRPVLFARTLSDCACVLGDRPREFAGSD